MRGMGWAVMAAAAAFLMLVLGWWWQPPAVAALSAAPAPAAPARPAALPKPPAVPRVAAQPVAVNHVVEACQSWPVSGSHTARTEWQARRGALEDAADVCPADQVRAGAVSCEAVAGAQGVDGYPALRCVQQAVCTVCGDRLARVLEVGR